MDEYRVPGRSSSHIEYEADRFVIDESFQIPAPPTLLAADTLDFDGLVSRWGHHVTRISKGWELFVDLGD
jgi:hypothetical protein